MSTTSDSKTGYNGPLFLSGEEVGNEGRAFAHAEGGISWELPSLGKFSWENAVANPATGRKTVVVGTDDTTPGQVYVYVGEKKATGNPAERAGLTGGKLFGIKVPGVAARAGQHRHSVRHRLHGRRPRRREEHDGGSARGGERRGQVTEWQRPEDASWDPKHPNDLYFAITSSFTTQSKLYRLRFDDPANPAAGGTVDQLLDGTENGGTAERFHMLDNITVDTRGHVMLQEDPGNQPYLARIWQYDIKRDALTEVATFDPALFTPGAAGFLTQDEESCGIIDAERDPRAAAGTCSTRRCTRRTPIPSWSRTASCWRCSCPGGGGLRTADVEDDG